jgi:hypothetical protein
MFNPYSQLGGNFINFTFSDVFSNADEFKAEYETSMLASSISKIKPESVDILYYLLYARYGNSVVASFDENQFKYKVFSIIFQYGPSWERRLEAQKVIRELSEEDIIKGTKRINNKSYNPSTAPTTDTLEELTTINEQYTDGWKKSKLEGYASLLALLDTDVTEEFISKFKKLFITIVEPNLPLWYETEV